MQNLVVCSELSNSTVYYFLFTLSGDDSQIIVKGKFIPNAVSTFKDCTKCFTLYSMADLFNRTSQLPSGTFCHDAIKARRKTICTQISTTVYGQVLIHPAE